MKNKYRYLHITLKGVNLSRIFKQCTNKNIQLYNLNRKSYKHLEFDIDIKSKNKVKEYAKSQNYEYQEDNSGFNRVVNFFKYRFGIVIGAIFFLIANILSGFFVWDIKIYGNSTISSSAIVEVLKNNNIKVGGIVSSSSLSGIETILTNQIEDISLCSVIKKGTAIIVNIKEKLKNEEIISMYNGKDIVATENFTIIELSVSNGTAQKKVGDSVKKGEVIVAGYVKNASGKKVTCKANATIKAKTWRTATEIYQKQIEINHRTGKKVKQQYLTLFGMKFPIKNQQNNFEFFEEEENEVTIKNNFLPFKMYVKTQYEVTKQMIAQNFEADKQIVVERCQKKAYESVKNGDEITNIFDVISEEKNCYVVTSYIEVCFELS